MFDQDLSRLSEEELDAELATQAARVDAELARMVALIGEFDDRLSLALDGTTFAGWVAWRCSLLPRQAREHERLAKALRELPLMRAAFARGELSYAKVSALVRVATPATETKLIELAEGTTASQLQRCIGAYLRITAADASSQQEREFLTWFWEDDGSLGLRGRLPAEEGALLLQALEAAREALRDRWRAQPADARVRADELLERPAECRISNTDAFVAMADLALANAAGDRSSPERYQVVVHVDAQTLERDDDGRCELADGRPLAAETARRLSCDGSIVELLEHNGETIALGRKRRTISPALRRALNARDRGCRFPGCDRTRFVDAHHMQHWSRGGETNLNNLVSLCRCHHRLVHERGYTIEIDNDGEVEFTNHYGLAVPSVPRPPPLDPDGRRDLAIDHRTCKCGTGDRMNLAGEVDAIIAIAA